jgi:hypothetical protein
VRKKGRGREKKEEKEGEKRKKVWKNFAVKNKR